MPLGRTCRGFLRRELFIECFNVSFLFKAAHNRKPTGEKKKGEVILRMSSETLLNGTVTQHCISLKCGGEPPLQQKKLQR